MIDAGKDLGPTFGEEVAKAQLPGILYGPNGKIDGADKWTAAQKRKLKKVIAAHDPAKQPEPDPSLTPKGG